jgi:hypothetical protein
VDNDHAVDRVMLFTVQFRGKEKVPFLQITALKDKSRANTWPTGDKQSTRETNPLGPLPVNWGCLRTGT